jgi:hypothetical protein
MAFPEMSSVFSGNVTVLPTCTFLGTYSLSFSSCKGLVLTNSGNNDVGLLESSGNSVGNAWFMSAVTSLDTPQETGTIGLGPGSENVLFAVAGGANSTVSLQVGNGASLIPEAANPEDADVTGFCSLVRLKDPSSGLYLSLDGCDSSTFGLSELDNSTTLLHAESVSQFELLPNHEEDAGVTTYLTNSEVLFRFQNPNSTETRSEVFPEGVVSVGLNASDVIIGFVCPQTTVDGTTFEVQIGEVGGSVDPATGAIMIVLDDVHWLVFGDIPGPDGIVTLEKENGVKVVLGNVTGGTQLTLPSAKTSDTPGDTAITAIVPAKTLRLPANATEQEIALVDALSEEFRILKPDTDVFWALYLMAPQTAQPGEYQEFATSVDQGVGEGGTAVSPTPSSPFPAPAASGSVLPTSLILFALILVFLLH